MLARVSSVIDIVQLLKGGPDVPTWIPMGPRRLYIHTVRDTIVLWRCSRPAPGARRQEAGRRRSAHVSSSRSARAHNHKPATPQTLILTIARTSRASKRPAEPFARSPVGSAYRRGLEGGKPWRHRARNGLLNANATVALTVG